MVRKAYQSARKKIAKASFFRLGKAILGAFRKIMVRILFIFNKNKVRIENNFYVFADPRGGSTWLMELLKSVKDTAVIWEPCHHKYGAVPHSLNLCNERLSRPYVPENTEWSELKDILGSIFEGKIMSGYTCSIAPFDYNKCDRFIVKFIRANALLPWIVKNFDFNYKPIYLLRHPIPVALSQMDTFQHHEKFESIRAPQQEYPEIIADHLEYLETLNTQLLRNVGLWCVHNLAALRSNCKTKWLMIYYEDLLLKPEKVLSEIFNEWGLPLPDRITEKVHHASRTDRESNLRVNPLNQLEKWNEKVDQSELERVEEILNYFQIKIYSAYSSLPIKSEL